MGKTQVSENDRPALETLEALVRKHRELTTAVLAAESGFRPEHIRDLLNNHSYRVSRSTETHPKQGIAADVWIYKLTPEEIAASDQARGK